MGTDYMKAEIKSPHSILDKYTALLDISCRLNSERNFDQLLKLIADEATKHVDAERATIFILDNKKGELWAKIALGVSDTIRFDARLGIAGAVLIAAKSLVVEDVYKSPLFYPSIDSITGFHTRNILSVPLRTPKREIIGVFQVLNKREGKFTTEDEKFIEALANQAAIALENAQALNDLENQKQELLVENETLRKEVEERFTSKSILGTSNKIGDIRTIIDKTAETSVSVLVTGENGTGKELSARAIHYTSTRRAKPFVAVNCAALPETLVESELFGIEKGVATGVERRVGRIESKRRIAFPRRNRRFESDGSSQVAARSAGARGGMGWRPPPRAGGYTPHRGHEQRPQRGDPAEPLPAGFVFPIECHSYPYAGAARDSHGHPAACDAFHAETFERYRT